MTYIKLMVDTARQLNQTWNECSKNAEEEITPEVYNAMCDVDEAVINLVEKISLCLKEKQSLICMVFLNYQKHIRLS